MVKRIDSDALGILTKSLGLSGAGSPLTELADGVVDQALSVNEIVRRGRTLAGGSGIFSAILSNINVDAQTLLSSINPYAVGATAQIEPYPDPVPEQFDVWLLAAAMRRQSGTGTIAAALSVQYPGRTQGWGLNTSSNAVVQVDPIVVAFWDAIFATSTNDGIRNGARGPWVQIGLRIPRGTGASTGTIRFSTVSSATSTYNCNMIIGLFPVALGQDGIV